MLDLSLSVKELKKLIPESPLEVLLMAVAAEELCETPRRSLLKRLRREIDSREPAQSEVIELEEERAREDDGTFQADDPSTPYVDEAWEPPKTTERAPRRMCGAPNTTHRRGPK